MKLTFERVMVMLPVKKPIFTAFFIAVSLVLLLTGCSSNGGATKTGSNVSNDRANETKPAEGGELTYALATAPDTLDPHASGMAVATRVIKSIFESLLYQDKNNELKPWLATEWEVSDDKKTYTFKLRQGVKFHDGEPFNAEAVKFNFERIVDPATKSVAGSVYLKPVKSVEVVDDYTVKIELEKPSATFLTLLAHSNISMVSPKAVKKYGDQFGQHPVGTGPFKFEKLSQNDEIVLSKFEDYHGHYPFAEHKGAAYLDKLVFKIVPEEATRIGSVQSGQIKAAETVPPQDIVSIKKGGQLKLWEAETGGLPYTIFVNNTTPPWNDVRARRALKQSIDIDSIVNTLYLGTYKRAWSVLSPVTFGYDKELEGKDTYDVEQANKTFDELGWKKDADGFRKKDGKTLTVRIIDDAVNREKRQDISLMIKEQLKKVGIDVKIETTTEAQAILSDSKAYDLRGNSRVALDPDDLTLFYHSEQIYGQRGFNIGWYKNAEVDRWLEQAAVEFDPAKREELYKKIQRKLIDDVASIPIYVFPYIVATTPDVQGLKFDSIGYPLFYDVNLKK
ncbi:ABC transporter substrate-binding protein [Parageobacillus thermoglucosidasius]|uniref:ABC transporter substrate-binding protein n=1 Tax=Parageobacillus thermoglucosidasius TaxID=1426 RepID=UPI003B674105